MYKFVKVGLCKGRHEIPGVENYIFPQECGMNFSELSGIAREFLIREFGDSTAHYYNVPQCYADSSDVRFWAMEGSLELYVTGFTPALVAVINACRCYGLSDLVLMHYDRETGEYVPQGVVW